MKKILFVVMFCSCLVGCGNKLGGYQISELQPNIDVGLAHLKGSIKNESNNTCNELVIQVTFSNGSLKDTGYVYVKSPEIGEIKSFNEILVGASGINNIDDYKIKVDNIECLETK